jgi:cysteine-rich repeat protein
VSSSVCGDGNLDLGCGEECDDSNNDDGDGCTGACIIEFCGDGIVNDAPNEDCDDGNTSSGDGCSADCQDEFCGDGIVNDAPNEDCDPPGSGACPPGSFCGADCSCGGIGTHKCQMDPNSALVIDTVLFPLGAPLVGSLDIDCGIGDPNTGKASCECLVQEIDPLSIPGIGFICLSGSTGCPLGEIDCDGGNAMDIDLISEHNIGACTSNADCVAQCDINCAGLGKTRDGDATCEGFCSTSGVACTLDTDCLPDGGSCGGQDGVLHGNICGCHCSSQGGAASRVGGLSCNLGADIIVEIRSPCGDGDVLISVGSACIPLTTESFTTVILDSNNSAPPVPIAGSLLGAPISCQDLASSVTTDLRMVGAINFFDSTVGDLAVALNFRCQ